MKWLAVIKEAVAEFDVFLKDSDWHGRENEIVNLFAHRFLANQISPRGPLRSLRQVGIEVAVRQVAGSKKDFVRKDLVIWPAEDMTVWIGKGVPCVVMEWKRDDSNKCGKDVGWLRNFCSKYPDTLGVSVCAQLSRPNRGCKIVAAECYSDHFPIAIREIQRRLEATEEGDS